MRRWMIAVLLLLSVRPALAGDRVPGEHWLRYANPAEAGFDVGRLEAAEAKWQAIPSSALMIIADGAVVASWGETERRFMCHSVRKSFLSALFGIYWDRGEIELNKTMADLGIDEDGDGLLPSEKQARILDLLKARSGVFHPAAYAGRTDSQPRGSQGPGRYFAYNNWDFNTLAAILEKETSNTVFEAFDEHFGKPLGMEDWRVTDGYFHYELEKSVYPAYPFRLSARDAARFGLLFAREGKWGERELLSRQWVRRSTALYSIDSDVWGYGFMWWIAREPRFTKHGLVAALGVGNQMIAALPDSDLVIVNRANTYEGQGTPMPALLDLIEEILNARTSEPKVDPVLVPLDTTSRSVELEELGPEQEALLEQLEGEWPFPPSPLGLPQQTTVTITRSEGHLVSFAPVAGTFVHSLQPNGWLLEEDSQNRYLPIRDERGAVAGIADASSIAAAALRKAGAREHKAARNFLDYLADEDGVEVETARALVDFLRGRRGAERTVEKQLRELAPGRVEGLINLTGYGFLRDQQLPVAQRVFELNTRLFPESFNVWDSLGEAHLTQGHLERALENYAKSLELNPENENARTQIESLRGGAKEGDGT